MAIYLSELVNTDGTPFGGVVPDGLVWQVSSTDVITEAGNGYIMNTAGGGLTITLPSSPQVGDQIGFKDYANTFNTNNLTIIPNGNPIRGVIGNLVIDLKGYGGSLIYSDAIQGWVIYSDYEQTYLPLEGGELGGNLTAPSFTEGGQLLENKYSSISHTHSGTYEPANTNIQTHIGTTTGNPHSVTKADVGLANVVNLDTTNAANITAGTIADARIPSNITRDDEINTATQNALTLKSDTTHLHTGVYEPYNVNIQTHIGNISNPHDVTKSQVGLGNVDNTSDAVKPVSTPQQTALNGKEDKSSKGQPNGYASLGVDGKVPTTQLPSYVDDVIEVSDFASLPLSGDTGIIYVTLDTNKAYRWSGSSYIQITSGAVDSVDGQTGVVDLSSIYEPINSNIQTHIGRIDNPHGVTKSQVGLGNVANVDTTNAANITSGTLNDARIPSSITRDNEVNTATQSALNLKSDTSHNHDLDYLSLTSGTLDGGTSTVLNVVSDDDGRSYIRLYGDSEGSGVVFVGQNENNGGGILYDGDGTPSPILGFSDYFSFFRKNSGVYNWTARNNSANNDWEFRGDVAALTFTEGGALLSSKYSPISHTHDASNITSGTLDDARIPSTITRDNEVNTATSSALSGKSDTSHNHDGVYSNTSHNHDGDYVDASYLSSLTGTDANNFIEGLGAVYIPNAVGNNAPNNEAVAVLNIPYSQDWNHQLAFEYDDPHIWTRRKEDGVWSAWALLWDSANDGAGSGLDADLLDGQDGSYYATSTHNHDGVYSPVSHTHNYTSSLAVSGADESTVLTDGVFETGYNYMYINDTANLGLGTFITHNSNNTRGFQFFISDFDLQDFYIRNQVSDGAAWSSWVKIWNDSNDGTGSGLDADLLDGQEGSYYATSTHTHSGTYEPANTNIQTHIGTTTGNPHSVTKADVGLANVVNLDTTNAANITAGILSDARIPSTITRDSELTTALSGYQLTSEKGVINGYASLDATGKVPSSQLPSYVDDVQEYANFASLPTTGTSGVIYVTIDTNRAYRWSGSVYTQITSGAVDSVNGYTGVVTLTKSDVGLGNVANVDTTNASNITSGTLDDARIPSTITRDSQLSNYLTVSGKAADSDLLDGIDSSGFLRSNTSDIFSGGELTIGEGSYINLTGNGGGDYISGSIFFENMKHAISVNDGFGSFNIRVGHTAETGSLLVTEDGFAGAIEYNQTTGTWGLYTTTSTKISGNSLGSVNTMYFDPTGTLNAPAIQEGGVALGSKYSLLSHNHNSTYLPLTGGTLVNGAGNAEISLDVSSVANLSQVSITGEDSNGTGILYVGQDDDYGGGIAYDGGGNLTNTGVGNDYLILYRKNLSTWSWTARQFWNSNDWEFRGNVEAASLSIGGSDLSTIFSSVSHNHDSSYLSATVDDISAGVITFQQGIKLGSSGEASIIYNDTTGTIDFVYN